MTTSLQLARCTLQVLRPKIRPVGNTGSGDPGGFPGFPDSTSPGPASAPIGQSGPHTANQNGGGLHSYIHTYNTMTMRPAR